MQFRLFLCGDVMTGRGIDQILPHPVRPHLYEPFVRSARQYVELAERHSGPIPRAVAFDYVWGDAMAVWHAMAPDLRVVNLETAVTASEHAWPEKGIHYRMHPRNVGVLTAAGIDCCALANNHVLDWGYEGLAETLATLRGAHVRTAGAGLDAAAAQTPAVLEVPGKGRVLLYAIGMPDSGVPREWAARAMRAGVNYVEGPGAATAATLARRIGADRRPGDIVVLSVHWGGNWGFGIAAAQRAFAHELIDLGAADVVHGHSSHHVKGIEVYRGRPVFYGCGDFLNDYEGIGSYESFRSDLSLMYFLDVDEGVFTGLAMVPMRTERFAIHRAHEADVQWLRDTLARECRQFGVGIALDDGPQPLLRAHFGAPKT